MKSKRILLGLFAFLIIALVIFRWYEFFTGPRVKQPLEYSHTVHTEMLKCEECHTGVLKSAAATIPDIKICMGCHKDQPISNSPEEIKLLDYIKNNREIPWQRLYRNPVHVYFSHNRHVSVGKLECVQCHGEMGKMTRPPLKALINLGMDYCIACHEKRHVDTSCVICHR